MCSMDDNDMLICLYCTASGKNIWIRQPACIKIVNIETSFLIIETGTRFRDILTSYFALTGTGCSRTQTTSAKQLRNRKISYL